MNLQERICDAFCAGFIIRPVRMGFSIRAPFRWLTDDYLVMYGRKKDGLIRFEDSGLTVSELQGIGADVLSGTRFQSLQSIMRECQVYFDEQDVVFHTKYVTDEQAGIAAIHFLEFMTRVQEFQLTTRARVENTFKDDLIDALIARFGAEHVAIDTAPVSRLSYYKVDIVVKPKKGKVAAIFPATSDSKALDATLFSKEVELKSVSNIVPFLIFDNLSKTIISAPTRSKAMNSNLVQADWAGGSSEVVDKIEKYITQAV